MSAQRALLLLLLLLAASSGTNTHPLEHHLPPQQVEFSTHMQVPVVQRLT